MIHAALQERAIFVDLAVDLPVGMIEAGLEQRGQIRVEVVLPRHRVFGDHLAARMASGAGVELGGDQLFGAPRDAVCRVHFPVAIIGRLQPVGQAHLVHAIGRLGLLA